MLEFQVTELQGDLDSIEEEVTVISTEQILQDGRILELEIDSDGRNPRLHSRFHKLANFVLQRNQSLIDCLYPSPCAHSNGFMLTYGRQ